MKEGDKAKVKRMCYKIRELRGHEIGWKGKEKNKESKLDWEKLFIRGRRLRLRLAHTNMPFGPRDKN